MSIICLVVDMCTGARKTATKRESKKVSKKGKSRARDDEGK